ncbi:DNA-processing protein DprA [Loigolactobacillus jiayinensis]|uniref:DNA-processing protein DprA n=1 Tax=Loigolactobacillus jiayinensis TaxID=2486016 RepID=A0ABW1RHL6_9LACO|nr:DNA-processing protein DprA [Loigolactobacillus jiayinensis]
MQLRTFLLKIHLCAGIGRLGELRVAEYLRQHPQAELESTQICQLARLNTVQTQRFKQAWISKLLADLLAQHQGLNVLTWVDTAYPRYLRESYQPPTVLFYQGDLSLLQRPLLALVGARQATEYTQRTLIQFMPTLVAQQVVTVSGLAAGADRMVHLTTLAAHGQTIAVIGTGLDIYYPRGNQALQQRIASDGLVLTEYPLGSAPQRYHFPERNRILAGLCQALCVTEARQHSGSLITANLALQANRNVLAVPGALWQPLSVGCNQLIAAGARPALSANDLLEELTII